MLACEFEKVIGIDLSVLVEVINIDVISTINKMSFRPKRSVVEKSQQYYLYSLASSVSNEQSKYCDSLIIFSSDGKRLP